MKTTRSVSVQLGHDFARTMKQRPVVRTVPLVGARAIKSLLAEIRWAGQTSKKAKVVFR